MPRPRKSAREENLAKTRQQLLEAAAIEFAREGYVGANINRISKAAGFAKGTIYNHFPSKRALMLALIEEIATTHTDFILQQVDLEEGSIQRMERFFNAGFAFVEHHPTQTQVIINAIYGSDDEFKQQAYQAYDSLFTTIIQDIVEAVLLDSPFFKTAKAYILYREQHSQIRQITTKANVDLVNHYIQKLDWKIKENSNMCYSLQGLNNYISSEVTSEYWLNSIYPPEIRQAHKDGDFHIHDLNLLSVYCVGWDLQDLLRQGFKGVEGKVESAPAKHLRSAPGGCRRRGRRGGRQGGGAPAGAGRGALCGYLCGSGGGCRPRGRAGTRDRQRRRAASRWRLQVCQRAVLGGLTPDLRVCATCGCLETRRFKPPTPQFHRSRCA